MEKQKGGHFNSTEIRSVNITWIEGCKQITVYLNNGERYCVRNDVGVSDKIEK